MPLQGTQGPPELGALLQRLEALEGEIAELRKEQKSLGHTIEGAQLAFLETVINGEQILRVVSSQADMMQLQKEQRASSSENTTMLHKIQESLAQQEIRRQTPSSTECPGCFDIPKSKVQAASSWIECCNRHCKQWWCNFHASELTPDVLSGKSQAELESLSWMCNRCSPYDVSEEG